MSLSMMDLNRLYVPEGFEVSIRLQEEGIILGAIQWDGTKIVNRQARMYTRQMIDRVANRLWVQTEVDSLVSLIKAQGEPAESPSNQNPESLEDSKTPQEDV